ncbi:MAG TPA: hypothetical protein DIC30_00295 [Oceanospirillales bacterium]|mgnify:FL=1|nr:hypothetical protein [Oceanospirillales bacterium]|tara:strand:- start:7713 stop:9095 length:1383 start_codon:yes stop_codon:yes gene_type:complete
MTMKNFIIKNLQAVSVLLFLSVSLQSSADLTALSDNALSDEALGQVTGQALFKIEEDTVPNSEGITFTKLTLGLEIAMNVNIDELNVGRYYRQGGNTCMAGQKGRFCDNTLATDPFNSWNCTENKCGGIDNYDGNNPLSASALVYGDLIGLSGAEKLGAALASVINDDHYANSAPFTRSDIFPSGFERTSDTDIRLRDMSFGRVIENQDGTQTLEDFIIQKPFIQFAHEDVTVGSETVRKIAGLRLGFGSSTGVQGQVIDAVSGFVRPVIDVSVDAGNLVGQAEFTFAPYLGGVRTVGFIDTDPNKTLVSPCSGSGIVCGSVEDAAKVSEASPQAQLFPMQNLVLDDSPAVWLSVQSKDVSYPSDTQEVDNGAGGTDSIKFDYETAKAGFWFNLGALGLSKNGTNVLQQVDGSSNYTSASLQEFNVLSGIQGKTAKPLHPDNYFSAHPNNTKYPQVNNYY